MLLAAIAARTERLRLGTAILQLPLAHPLRIAEEIASLDVLSAGRVELGIGRGGNPVHFAGFGVPLAESRARFEESYRFIRSAFAGEQFSFQGQYHSAPKLALVPQPHQPGGPRFHVAANSGETAFWAGSEGLSMLLASNVHPLPAMPKLLDAYRAGHLAGICAIGQYHRLHKLQMHRLRVGQCLWHGVNRRTWHADFVEALSPIPAHFAKQQRAQLRHQGVFVLKSCPVGGKARVTQPVGSIQLDSQFGKQTVIAATNQQLAICRVKGLIGHKARVT